MAIQPIDLQAIFSQVDKVGKAQMAQREGQAVQQALQGVHLQQKTEEQIRAVNETQNTGDDGTEKIKDRKNKGQQEAKKDKNMQQEKEQEDAPRQVIKDYSLGRNIDISL